MFEINDNFLINAGYNTSAMDDDQRESLRAQYATDFSKRVLMRLAQELSEEEAGEFSDIQESHERALRWLNEFHGDFRERSDYRLLLDVLKSEQEANMVYAGILWMGYAVPKFGELIQEELDQFQRDLISKRQSANDLLTELEAEDE